MDNWAPPSLVHFVASAFEGLESRSTSERGENQLAHRVIRREACYPSPSAQPSTTAAELGIGSMVATGVGSLRNSALCVETAAEAKVV